MQRILGTTSTILTLVAMAFAAGRPALAEDGPDLGAPDGAVLMGDGFMFPEGPIIGLDGTFYFSDPRASLIYKWDGSSFEVFFDGPGGANGLAMDQEGNIYGCAGQGRAIYKIAPDASYEIVLDSVDGKPLNSPNDIVIDAHGNIFFTNPAGMSGQTDENGMPTSVVRIRPDGSAKIVATDATYPNGIGISPDGTTLYVNDLLGGTVLYRYSLDEKGELGPAEVVKNFGGGMLDGMAIAESGNLYLAMNIKSQVVKLSPDGEILETYQFARGSGVTNVCFGGQDMSTLYVTLGNKSQVFSMDVGEAGLKLYSHR